MPYLGEETQVVENGKAVPASLDFWKFIGESLAVLWKDWPMNMRVIGYVGLDGKPEFVLDGECPHPHHGAHVTFNRVGQIYIDSYDTQGSPIIPDRCVAIMKCPGCFNYVLCIARKKPGSVYLEYEAHYPIGDAVQWENPDPEKPDIPEHILSDFNEALRCHSVDASNATAEMCRRALQAICLEKGANPKLKLGEQIAELAQKGIITSYLRKRADVIKSGGDRGAHPPDEPMGEAPLTEEDADALIDFTSELLRGLYVSEARLDRHDFSKRARKRKP